VLSPALLPLSAWLVAGVPAAQAPGGPASGGAPGPDRPAEARPEPRIKQLSETRYRLGAVEFDKRTREISFPGKVNMVKGLLEYLLVHENGKLHEALLSTPARPFDLNVVLLLLDYKPLPEWFDGRDKPRSLAGVGVASQLGVFVHWEDANGRRQSTRAETWVNDLRTRKPAPDAPWVFNGSGLNEDRMFCAEVDGSIAALYLDDRALLNNPRPGNADDERWEPARGLPPKGTPVTIVLKPVTPTPPP
jgi:hypothetical protein